MAPLAQAAGCRAQMARGTLALMLTFFFIWLTWGPTKSSHHIQRSSNTAARSTRGSVSETKHAERLAAGWRRMTAGHFQTRSHSSQPVIREAVWHSELSRGSLCYTTLVLRERSSWKSMTWRKTRELVLSLVFILLLLYNTYTYCATSHSFLTYFKQCTRTECQGTTLSWSLVMYCFCPVWQGEIKPLLIVWSENSVLNNLKWSNEDCLIVWFKDFLIYEYDKQKIWDGALPASNHKRNTRSDDGRTTHPLLSTIQFLKRYRNLRDWWKDVKSGFFSKKQFGRPLCSLRRPRIRSSSLKEKTFRAFNTGPRCAFNTLSCTLCAAVALLLTILT